MAIMRLFLLPAMCAVAVLAPVSAHLPTGRPFHITGRVYCDTCCAGFETTATTFIAGAIVRMECKDSETMGLKYSLEATTDSTGTYTFTVEDDHEDQICSCALLHSPVPHCNVADPGRCRATAVVTRRMNGVVNDNHVVNNMGFFINKPLSGCEQLLKHYFPTDEDH